MRIDDSCHGHITAEKAIQIDKKFYNKDAASLHLYYKFDPSLQLNEVVEQLNTFEQINIKKNDNTLTIY